jgi:type IX secretion system PorP/SprF family membrane protein
LVLSFDYLEFMDLKSFISVAKKVFIILISTFSFNLSNGQQMPFYPISYRIFDPFIFNPAIAGSKDFFNIDLLESNYNKSNSELVCGNLRLSKSHPDYFSSPDAPEFTHVGVGGVIYNELNGLSHNIGISGSVSYHIQLDKDALSFLSFGISVKAVSNHYSGDPDFSKPAKNTVFPNFDAGIYYYSKHLFVGVSATNILGNPEDPDSLGFYTIPVSHQLFFQIGYKVVLSKPLNILLEPSLIVNSDDSFSGKITDMLKPMLKLYIGNICIGTYFNDFNKTSFFFQYNYRRFYIGTYFELPKDSPFYKEPILTEFTLGLNISAIKSGISRRNHW